MNAPSLFALSASLMLTTVTLPHAAEPAQPNPQVQVPKKANARVVVEVNGLAEARGSCRVSLFNAAEGFPANHLGSLKHSSQKAMQGKMVFVFEDLPPGEYAVAVLHDINENQKLDTNMVGKPKEPYAVSNNIRNLMSAPSFAQAKFALQQDQNVRLSLQLIQP